MPHTLNYHPSGRRDRRRRLIILVFLVTTVLFALRYRSQLLQLRQKVSILLAQRRCLAYTAPASEIVFDDGPSNDELRLQNPRLQRITRPYYSYQSCSPTCWQQYCKLVQKNPSASSAALLFLHGRATTAGTTRLVAVEMTEGVHDGGTYLRTTSIVPETFAQPASCISGSYARVQVAPLWYSYAFVSGLRFFAGQPDPNDSSHFTIPFTIGRKTSGIIDGYLLHSGLVTLDVRNERELTDALQERVGRGE